MKLQELTEDYGILPEPQQPPTLNKYVGNVNGLDIWEDDTVKENYTTLGLKENEQTIAFCNDTQLSYGDLRKIFNILGETKTEIVLEV